MLPVVCLFFIWLALCARQVEGDARYMCTSHCTTPLATGTYIMGAYATPSSSYSIQVTRNGASISSGYSFPAGDTAVYAASINAGGRQWAMEISGGGANFNSGYCNGYVRIYQDVSDFSFTVSSVPAGTTVTLIAGHSPRKTVVGITPVFTLTAAATPTQTPTLIPTWAPSVKGGTKNPTFKPTTAAPSFSPTTRATPAPSSFSASVPSSQMSSYSQSCALAPSLQLSWTVLPDKTIQGQLTLSGSSTNWLSFGLVLNGVTSMVGPPSAPNRVFLYEPNYHYAGYFLVNGKSAGSIVPDKTVYKNFGVTDISTSVSSATSTMSFKLGTVGETRGAVPADLSSAGNTIMYAHGGNWPDIHPPGSYGFSTIDWSGGSCQQVAEAETVSPYVVFALLLVVIIYNSEYSPIKQLAFVQSLNATRVPFVFAGLSDVSAPGAVFVLLYIIVNLLVLLVGLDTSKALEWGDVTVATGEVAVMNMWMALIPASKSSFVTLGLFGVPFERAVKYHKLVVSIGMLFALLHLLANNSANADVFYSSLPFGEAGVVPIYGLVAFVIFLSQAAMAFEPIRRAQYEAFQIFHKLYWLAILMVFLHVKTKALGFLPGMILQAWDLLVKLFRVYSALPALGLELLSSGEGDASKIVRLVVPCGFEAAQRLGQYYFVNIPELSQFEWHPFSVCQITTGKTDDAKDFAVHFLIKPVGDKNSFTRRLASLAASSTQTTSPPVKVALDGPYGDLSIRVNNFCCCLLTCGGIGITPIIHALETIVRSRGKGKGKGAYNSVVILRLVWVVRDLGAAQPFLARLERIMARASPSSPATLSTGDDADVPLGARDVTVSPLVSPRTPHPTPTDAALTTGRPSKRVPAEGSSSSQHPAEAGVAMVPIAHDGPRLGDASRHHRDYNAPAPFLRVDLYVTGAAEPQAKENPPNPVPAGVRILRGRPSADAVVMGVVLETAQILDVSPRAAAKVTCALVCGPAALTSDVTKACLRENVSLHNEVFSP